MEFNYNDLLRERLYDVASDLGVEGYDFEVDEEQAFLKVKDLKPNTIYVLTKMLQNDISIGVETQPLQIFILSEQNSLDTCTVIFKEFAKKYNFQALITGNLWVKQQYTDPVVLSNFNNVDYGYRSILYVSATLYIMKDVIDVSNVKIDNVAVTPLSFSVSYSMSTNSQPTASEYIASSLKTVSSFAVTISIPLVESAAVKKVLNIMAETDNTGNTQLPVEQRIAYNGNNPFSISFDCKVANSNYSLTISKPYMRLISAQLITAPNQVPSLQLGFMK